MQHYLFRSGHDVDLRSNNKNDLLRSNYSSFDVPQQEKQDATKMNVVPLLSQGLLLYRKAFFPQKRSFFSFFFFALWRPNR